MRTFFDKFKLKIIRPNDNEFLPVAYSFLNQLWKKFGDIKCTDVFHLYHDFPRKKKLKFQVFKFGSVTLKKIKGELFWIFFKRTQKKFRS